MFKCKVAVGLALSWALSACTPEPTSPAESTDVLAAETLADSGSMDGIGSSKPDTGPQDLTQPEPDVPDVAELDVAQPDVIAPDLLEDDVLEVDVLEVDVPEDDVPEDDAGEIDVPEADEQTAETVETVEDVVTCPPKSEGCNCDNDTCNAGLVCDSATKQCRLPLTCATADCKPAQKCTESVSDKDAVCEKACDAQFTFDSISGTCVGCVSSGCTAEPCDPTNPALQVCIAKNLGCVTTGGTPGCGTCLNGYKSAAGGACIFAPSCGAVACPVGKYCDVSNDATPTCLPLPCPGFGQAATSHDVTAPKCKDCSALKCNGTGLTGLAWAYTDANGNCLCETKLNFFLGTGAATTANACDADGDGWIRSDAAEVMAGADIDMKANARCQLRQVTGVRLQDEYGMVKEFVWCGGATIVEASVCPGNGTAQPMRLIETDRNDVPRGVNEPDSPVYGTTGRQFKPSELTWLTKACTDKGDYNGDFQTDINETQVGNLPKGTNIPEWTPDQKALHQFSYFVELYVASFEAQPPTSLLGKLLIREKSRCDVAFPLHYEAVNLTTAPTATNYPYAEALTPPDNPYWYKGNATPEVPPPYGGKDVYAKDYWRNCQRNRDPAFSQVAQPGFDFARFACSLAGGTCPVLPPAHPQVNADQTAGFNAEAKLLRGHGLCNLGSGKVPKDNLWRGLMHHSQFKCVRVVGGPVNDASFEFKQVAFASVELAAPLEDKVPKWVFNQCTTLACDPAKAPCQTPSGGALSMLHPVIQCNAVADTQVNPGVGWAARTFSPYGQASDSPDGQASVGSTSYTWGSYQGGCMDENLSWTYSETLGGKPITQSILCPYPSYDSSVFGTQVLAQEKKVVVSFGRYGCWNDLLNFLWADDKGQTKPTWSKACFDTKDSCADGTIVASEVQWR